jgi:hypothetical protein
LTGRPLINTVLELQDTYHDAAEASIRAVRKLDELAIAVAAPSKTLALARAAASVQTRRRGGQGTWADDNSSHDLPRTDVSFIDSRASTGLPGPVERAIRRRRIHDPVILLRAAAIDNAARDLIGLAGSAPPPEPGPEINADNARRPDDAVLLSVQSFPNNPVLIQSANVSPGQPGSRLGSAPSARAQLPRN